MNICVLDGYTLNPGDLDWGSLSKLGNLKVYDRTMPSEIIERAIESEIVLTNKVIIDDNTMAQLPKLRYIGVLATGYNVVDIEAARKRGIIVTNIPAYSTNSVAQMVFAHILNIVQQVDTYAKEAQEGKWTNCPDFCYYNHTLMELAGKTIGIVGLGNTGMATARIAAAFGMKVVALTSKTADRLPEGITPVSLDELLQKSDIVSLHCPLNDSTRGLIGAEAIARMKPGALLLNAARGPVVDTAALAAALNEGRLGGAGIDVFETEPPLDPAHPLLHGKNTIVTPHVDFASAESMEASCKIVFDNIAQWMDGHQTNIIL